MKAYPAYKQSGVEWLGDVPEGWEVKRLKYELHEVDDRAEDQQLELLGLSKSMGVVPRSQLSQGAAESDNYEKYKVVRPGELVMNKMQAWNGVFGLSSHHGMVSPDYSVFAISRPAYATFICEALRTDQAAGELFTRCRGMGTAFLRLNTSDFLDVSLAFPPQDDVSSIAGFLDVEVGKIDALVAEQRRLIALLAEKRQAVISHAVTQGLNPSAPRKASGIDWLGDIPQGWEVMPLRRLVALNPSKSEAAQRHRDEEVSFLPMEAVGQDGSIDLSRTRPIGEVETGYTYLREGDVAFAKITPCFENGKGALMRGLVGGIAFGTTELTVLRPLDDRLGAEFLACLVASPLFLRMGEGHMYGAGGQKRVPDDFAREFRIALPPRDEQDAIVVHLKAIHDHFDALTSTSDSVISLLQERRAALISAAVTGKIDVTNRAVLSDQAL